MVKKIGTYQAECNTIQLTRKFSLLQNSHPSIHKNSDQRGTASHLRKKLNQSTQRARVYPLPWSFYSKKHWSEVKILWMSLKCWPWMLTIICRPYVGHTLSLKHSQKHIKTIIKPWKLRDFDPTQLNQHSTSGWGRASAHDSCAPAAQWPEAAAFTTRRQSRKKCKNWRGKIGKNLETSGKMWGKNAQKFLNMIRNHASSTTLKFSPGLPILASPLLI